MFGRNRLGQYGVQGMGDIPRLPQMGQPDPNDIQMTPQAQQAMMNAPRKPEKQPGFWQGGDKFTLKDGLAGALAAIGDGFSSWANGPSAAGGARSLIGGRMSAIKQAKAAQAASQRAAEKERQRQLERQEGLADYEARKGIDQRYQGEDGPGVFTDNPGNRWLYDKRTGRTIGDAPVFVDRSPRFIQQGSAILNIPNPYAGSKQGGAQGGPQLPPDTLPADFFSRGGTGSNVGGGFR